MLADALPIRLGLPFQQILRGDKHSRRAKAAMMLVGVEVTPARLSEGSLALGEELDPQDDQQASVAMRRHLAKVFLARGVSALLGRTDLGAGALG